MKSTKKSCVSLCVLMKLTKINQVVISEGVAELFITGHCETDGRWEGRFDTHVLSGFGERYRQRKLTKQRKHNNKEEVLTNIEL